ncbi:hypothetical protein FOL47_004252 [Perkinsus chesapeaki]|uniref:Uncharacterized protein n=1 Tax=Perkinsus chesapeaki TaxID=330153 RepID=A0A7J6M3P1_PERCH|nr:hypothetical protein FOL47_004252 [Perkinsus chesapeaki]
MTNATTHDVLSTRTLLSLACLLRKSRGVPMEICISTWDYLRPSIRGFNRGQQYNVDTEDGNIYPVYTKLTQSNDCHLVWVAYPDDKYVLEGLSLDGTRSRLAEIPLPYVHNSICADIRKGGPCITFVFNSSVTQVTAWSITGTSPRSELPVADIMQCGVATDLLVEIATGAPFSNAIYGVLPGLGFSRNLLIRMTPLGGMWACDNLCIVPNLIQGFAILDTDIVILTGLGDHPDQTVLQRRDGSGWETLLIIPRQCASMDIDHRRNWIYILGGSPDVPNWRLWIYSFQTRTVVHELDLTMEGGARGGTGIAANAANITPERLFVRPDGALWISRILQPDPELLDFDHRIETWYPVVD